MLVLFLNELFNKDLMLFEPTVTSVNIQGKFRQNMHIQQHHSTIIEIPNR